MDVNTKEATTRVSEQVRQNLIYHLNSAALPEYGDTDIKVKFILLFYCSEDKIAGEHQEAPTPLHWT